MPIEYGTCTRNQQNENSNSFNNNQPFWISRSEHSATRYGSDVVGNDHCSGSVSFWASRIRIRSVLPSQAKKCRKPLVSTVWLLLNDLLSLQTDVNVPTENNKQKILEKLFTFVVMLKATDEKSRIRSLIQSMYRSKDPSSSQNTTNPEHW